MSKPESETAMPDEIDLRFAKRLQKILSDVAGRPLTPEEIARTHQHVATSRAIFEAESATSRSILDAEIKNV